MIELIVRRNGKRTFAVVSINSCPILRGVSRCGPNDKFDIEIGLGVALLKSHTFQDQFGKRDRVYDVCLQAPARRKLSILEFERILYLRDVFHRRCTEEAYKQRVSVDWDKQNNKWKSRIITATEPAILAERIGKWLGHKLAQGG